MCCQLECSGSVSVSSSSPQHHSNSVHPVSLTAPAAVVVFESAFSRLHVQTSHTTRIQNYDRSEVTTTSTRHRDGVETVSELVAWPDGCLMVHELVRNMASGRTSEYPAVAAATIIVFNATLLIVRMYRSCLYTRSNYPHYSRRSL